MIASSWLPVSVSTRPPSSKPSAPLHPSEDREAGTVEREGVFGRSPVRPSGATSLTSFHPWEARGHFKEGGPDALQGCGTSGGGGRGQSRSTVLPVGQRHPSLQASAASWLLSHCFWSDFGTVRVGARREAASGC